MRTVRSLAVPVVDLPDDELAAVVAALRRLIDEDKYPHAPRLDPLRAALARLEAASKPTPHQTKSAKFADLKPKAPPPVKGDKQA